MKKDDFGKLKPPDDCLSAKQSSRYVTYGGELHLSNTAQLELLCCMRERGVPLRNTVRGFSMAPFIKDNDVLTIEPLRKQKLRPGEVVAFTHPHNGKLVIHRIIAKKDNKWLLRGDSCSRDDGAVDQELIIGRVTRVERNGREVRIGLGLRGCNFIIAWLSRHNLLTTFVRLAYKPILLIRLKRGKHGS